MERIWASIRERIDSLEARRASRLEWSRAADESRDITDLASLRATLVRNELPSAETQRIEALFRSSRRTVEYVFEGDFHALVFFDSADRAMHVVKWA